MIPESLRYHVSVHPLAERVLFNVQRQELLKAGERVGVAVSGGIDSVALLRLLLELRGELGVVLSVVHFNHKLRGDESDGDEHFVAELAREYDLPFYADSDDVAQQAADEHVSVETAARDLRYGFFRYLLGESGPQAVKPNSSSAANGTAEAVALHESPSLRSALPQSTALDKIVTGHTLDDQAETVLMRLIRGAGLRGLGGIHPRLVVENDEGEICGEIVRPLLGFRRQELEKYLKDVGQPWREDSTNTDERFTRNRVRKLVVPMLEQEFNPAVAENLADFAEIARGDEDYWENEIAGWLGTTVQWCEPDWARDRSHDIGLVQIGSLGYKPEHSKPADPDLRLRIDNASWLVVNASLSRMWFLAEPVAVQRRLVKAIGEHVRLPLDFKHVEEILRFASEDGRSGKEMSLPLGWKMARETRDVTVRNSGPAGSGARSRTMSTKSPVPGRTVVVETGSYFEVQRVRRRRGCRV